MSAYLTHRWSIQIQVADPQFAAQWLTDNLFFQTISKNNSLSAKQRQVSVSNENLVIELISGSANPLTNPPKGHYYTGLAHIALRTMNIMEAVDWCRKRELTILLNDGQPFFNPKVYGGGARYFQVVTPFGLTIEISQRVDFISPFQKTIISGLCHVGLPSPTIESEMAFFHQLGFQNDFAPVTNWNEAEGTIFCCMLSQKDPAGNELTVEIYQFADLKPTSLPSDYGLKGLKLGLGPASSPGGVKIIN